MLKVEIESLIFGGRGFARTNEGKAVFIPHVIPGETVHAKIVKKHASYLEAVPEEIVKASPKRVEPLCSYFTLCGGCDWQHIQYSEQIKFKETILKNHLRKVISDQHTIYYKPVISPREYEYRNNIRLQCRDNSAGYYIRNTNDVVGIDDCPIAERRIRYILPFLLKYLSTVLKNKIASFEIFAIGDGIQLIVHSGQKIDGKMITEISRICNDLNMSGAVIVHLGSGSHEAVGEVSFKYSIETNERGFSIMGGLGGFIQANLNVNQSMVGHVLDSVKGAEKVLDLYCGCGNFTIPLASACKEVTGIDHDSRLTGFVTNNANINGLENVHVITSDTGSSLDLLTAMKTRYDTVLMDPPRAGAANLLNNIKVINPEKIVYVSCDTATLARDLQVLQKSGYILKSLRMFDMFPQTYHIETVACLKR
jgi:23S rRNA (uracil1939-C5)-methyltransferase